MGTSRILSVPIAEYAKRTSLSSTTFLDEKLNLSLGTKVPMSESNASTGKNTGIGPNTLVNIETGSENTAIGYNSLNATTIGSANVGIGNNTLESLENGYDNVAIGNLSLSASVSGVANVGIGKGALAYGDKGHNNIAIGKWVLAGNKADMNIGIGAYALTNNVTGTNNIGIGPSTLRFNEDGTNNVAIGPNAGQFLNSEANVFIGNHAGNLTTTGRENIAIGANAFQNNTDGRNNTLVGGGVGSNIDGGSYNAIYGDQSGLNVTTSSNLTLIGRGADIASAEQLQSPTQIQNSTAIGANAIVTTSNTIQLGNQGVTLVNTSGTISATAFIGDGSGLTNITGAVDIDSNGNLIVIEGRNISSTESITDSILLGDGVASLLTYGADNIAIGTNALVSADSNMNSVAIGRDALSNINNTPNPNQEGDIDEMIQQSDNPSTTLDESIYGFPGNIAIGAGAYASPQTLTTTYTLVSQSNISIGHMSMYNATKSTGSNIALGSYTLPVLEEGGGNITMGWGGLKNLEKGDSNIAIGQNSMENSSHVQNNVAIGRSAMRSSKFSDKNTAIGNYALYNLGSNLDQLYTWQEEGDEIYSHMNTAIGHAPLISLQEGNFNTSVGALSLYNLLAGYRNVALGFHTLYDLEGGELNTAIGDGAGFGTTGSISKTTLLGAGTRVDSGIVNSTAIGAGAIVTSSNTIQLGDNNIELVNTSGIISATAFYGDGSGLTNVGGSSEIDSNGNLIVVDVEPTLTPSQTHNILVGAGVAPDLTNGYNNIGIGGSALASATTTFDNVAIGPYALASASSAFPSNTSSSSSALNIAIGHSALESMQSGWVNVAIGTTALLNTEKGTGNIAIGAGTIEDPTYAQNNIALGTDAIHQRDNMNSVAIGTEALFNVTNIPDESNWGINPEISNLEDFIENTDHPSTTLDESAYGLEGNIAIGAGAFASPQSTTSTITEFSMGNIAIGHMSMNNSTKSTGGNIAIGSQTLPVLEEGGGIVSIGSWAMNQFKDGYNIAAVGSGAGQNLVKGTYTTAIGNAAMRDAKYTFGNVAIGSFSLLKIGKDLDSYFDADNNRNDFDNNTSVGHASSSSLVEGSGNTVVGAYAMQSMSGGNTIDFGDWEYVSGQGNTAIGGSSMHAATGGSWNTALGHVTFAHNTTGFNNVALGVYSLNKNTEGVDNVSTGAYSLQKNTTGSSNTAIGSHSLNQNTEGSNNIGIGSSVMINHLFSNENIAIGNSAMAGLWDDNAELSLVLSGTYQMNNEYDNNFEFTHNNQNIAIGGNALRMNNGMWNVGVGASALEMANLGAKNVGVGPFSLQFVGDNVGNSALGYFTLGSINFSGKNNIAMGIAAGSGLATGASMQIDNDHNSSDFNIFIGALSGSAGTPFYGGNNIFLGPNINAGKDFMYNTVAIGANIVPTDDNLMVFGNSSHNKWAFGLATTDSGKVIQVGDDTTNGNGAYLTAGGTWTNGSSILFKTNFIDLSSEWILDKISKLNIRKWDYKNTNETHIGPTSEEFINLFGVGIKNENSHISTIDVSGVALKGVQALIDENEIQRQQLKDQSDLINELYNRILALEKRVNE